MPTPTASLAAPPIPGLYGVRPEKVVELIRARSLGRPRAEGRRLALVLEGGAMRATAPAGGLLALSHLGLVEGFDAVYATSAGAINASYFLAGQGDLGITIYFEDLTTGRFIDRRRFWKIVDVDYVFDEVVTQRKPLEVARVLASPTQFFVTVMDQATGQASIIDTRTTTAPLLSVLKAALAIPVLYNRAVEFDGKSYLDGGLQIPIPLQRAIDDGCTDILVLLSRDAEYISPEPHWSMRLLFHVMSGRGRPGFRETFARHHLYARAARDLALGAAKAIPPGVNIATVCMEASEPISRTTVDPALLRAAAVSYGRRTLRLMGADAGAWALGPATAISWPAVSARETSAPA